MNKLSARDWINRIDHGKKFREEKIGNRWDTFINLFKGNQVKPFQINPRVVVNLVFSNARTLLPALYTFDPHFIIKPRRRQDVKLAPIVEALINYEWKELSAKKQVRRAILDAYLLGYGIIKVGWQFETIKADDKEVGLLENNEYIKEDQPFILRISPRKFIIDTKALDLETAAWVAEEIKKPIRDVKADPKYRHTRDLKGSKVEIGEGVEETEVTLYEIWDKKHGRLRVIAEGHDEFIRDEDLPYAAMEGFPYEMLFFNEVPDELFPVPDVSQYEQLQDEVNRNRTAMVNHIKRFVRVLLYQKGIITEEEADQIMKAEDAEILCVTDINAAKFLEYAVTPPDWYNMDALLKGDVQMVSGITELQRGGASDAKTATEASIKNLYTQSRTGDYLDLIETWLSNVARKLIQLMQENMEASDVSIITGEELMKLGLVESEEEANLWQFSREEIQGEYRVTVEAGSTSQAANTMKIKQHLDTYNLLANAPEVNRSALIRKVLEALGWKDAEELLLPEQPAIPGMIPGGQGTVKAATTVGRPPELGASPPMLGNLTRTAM